MSKNECSPYAVEIAPGLWEVGYVDGDCRVIVACGSSYEEATKAALARLEAEALEMRSRVGRLRHGLAKASGREATASDPIQSDD